MQTLSSAELGMRVSANGPPDGQPIALGSAGDFFGNALAATGTRLDLSGSPTRDECDLAVGGIGISDLFLFPAQPATSTGSSFAGSAITVSGTSSGLGLSVAAGLQPAFGLLGDLDGDGLGELLVGTATSREVMVWYPDSLASAVQGGAVAQASGLTSLPAGGASGAGELVVQYVGDWNGDGYYDFAVGDFRASAEAGSLVLVY